MDSEPNPSDRTDETKGSGRPSSPTSGISYVHKTNQGNPAPAQRTRPDSAATPTKRARTDSDPTWASSNRMVTDSATANTSNAVLQHLEENEHLRRRVEHCENHILALEALVAKLQADVAQLASLKPAIQKIDDLANVVSQLQSRITKLKPIEEKQEQLANLVASMQQKITDHTANNDTFQLATRALTPRGFSTTHPSQSALLEFLHGFNHQTLLPTHFESLGSAMNIYLESYLESYSDWDGSLPANLLHRRFIKPEEKIAPEALAKQLLALDPKVMDLTLNKNLIHPAINMALFEHFQEEPDLPLSHARLRRALQYVAKTSSEWPLTHFNQRWPQVIRDSIVFFYASLEDEAPQLGPSKFSEFLMKIRELQSILREINDPDETNIIKRLRKRPVHYLCAFLVSGVAGLIYAPGSKAIPPECLVVLVAYLKWYLSRPAALSLEPDPYWPRSHMAILMLLKAGDEVSDLDQMVACGMTIDYIAFWNRHSSKEIPWPHWRSLREAEKMPAEISSKMMAFINSTDDAGSELSQSQSRALDITDNGSSSQNPPAPAQNLTS
ncbi:hypothetical protein PtA15_13A149 [Puccinia triticina]|uniref:Uncharacterized protein n=3 Tax=Puccinia triticina TaxID=208348 RepID=A0ABY7D1H9_9BASI|nr:uncharacterized protein PtA15_13A149 [Puccinia triticina]WAQ90750.1 hypothetical protein PtA15_13A149 [Puccinia triticina]WAR60934.1 hypothetical protein PtB15_13B185 [Puccinia triticina]